MNKYLTETEITAIIGTVEVSEGFMLMSQDSYNEELIAKKINLSRDKNELFQCTLNMSLVGFGNKRYGTYRQGDQIIDIGTTLRNHGVKLNNPQSAQLKEDDITPQRLCRFFRYHIRDFIRKNDVSSYLFRKYTDRNLKYREIVFRGAEYLDDLQDDEFNYLLEATKNLDNRLGTNISERVIRINEAKKGVFYNTLTPKKT